MGLVPQDVVLASFLRGGVFGGDSRWGPYLDVLPDHLIPRLDSFGGGDYGALADATLERAGTDSLWTLDSVYRGEDGGEGMRDSAELRPHPAVGMGRKVASWKAFVKLFKSSTISGLRGSPGSEAQRQQYETLTESGKLSTRRNQESHDEIPRRAVATSRGDGANGAPARGAIASTLRIDRAASTAVRAARSRIARRHRRSASSSPPGTVPPAGAYPVPTSVLVRTLSETDKHSLASVTRVSDATINSLKIGVERNLTRLDTALEWQYQENWAAEPEVGEAARRREQRAESAQFMPCRAVILAGRAVHQGAEGWLERGWSRGGTQGQPGCFCVEISLTASNAMHKHKETVSISLHLRPLFVSG
ncbi:hypothetical protein THAOC_01073 [Thalassiosira oceanica]|uniref:Uncharacterized protein n=1 Tax=Thalassiosira oceanica TaxID=159749 RepID=K0TR37_THAOC|nr:hypothetical protein THAOC_01073 [Thalassiosira oceanica]|eukprot:EJK77117.1 hypothetical protein THAOC_01073 [Thalassiosira oceanica]